MKRRSFLALCGSSAASLAISCGRPAAPIAGSKNFTEQIVLGEIAAQTLERRLKTRVIRRLDLGGTLLAHLALENGDIDFYPEYTGTALTAVLKQPLAADPNSVFATVSRLYLERFRLLWLPPLGFNDTFAMVARAQDAARLAAPTLSAAAARAWRLGVGYEFLTRPDGLRRLDQLYPLRWDGPATTMDLGLLYRALDEGQIDLAAANSTDGLLATGRYTVLADDRHAFPPYQACFVLRSDALRRLPGIHDALAGLSGSLDDASMRRLNQRVDADHEAVVRVAADFLNSTTIASRRPL